MSTLPQKPFDEWSDDEWLAARSAKSLRNKSASRFSGDAALTQAEAWKVLSVIGEFLYAARFADGSIKIGHSRNLGNRKRSLGSHGRDYGHGAEFSFIAIARGSRDDEARIHERLASSRVAGSGYEWYRPTASVMAVVNSWRADLGREPVAA